MASMADIPNYENMVSALSTFAQQIFEASGQMSSAGEAVVSGTNNDQAAVKASAKIDSLQRPVGEICAEARRIAQALIEEMEEIKRAAAIADSFD